MPRPDDSPGSRGQTLDVKVTIVGMDRLIDAIASGLTDADEREMAMALRRARLFSLRLRRFAQALKRLDEAH